MQINKEYHSWLEACACLYLLSPLLLFFLLFASIPLAIVGGGFIGLAAWDICKGSQRLACTLPAGGYLAATTFAIVWLITTGSFGFFFQGSDWFKHFAVLNFLAGSQDGLYVTSGPEVLRYSIGWYLVPGLVLKYTDTGWQTAISGLWSLIGVGLFFGLLIARAGDTRRAFLAPVVFALFSGADIVGYGLTGFQRGPSGHLEWWAGWIEYASNTTSLAWVHQHAIPAWLMIALLMRQLERPTMLPHMALLFAATLLWSPLVAMGLLPFALYVGLGRGVGTVLSNWRTWCGAGLSLPVVIYLTADSQDIPSGFIWDMGCVGDQPSPCFSWVSYFQFVSIEFLAIFAVLVAWKKVGGGLLLIAGVSLLLIPMYRIGLMNDFGMRASLPALTVLAMLSAQLVVTASRKHVVPMLVILAIGAVTPALEIRRGAAVGSKVPTDYDFSRLLKEKPKVRSQYFANPPGGGLVLRDRVRTASD